MSQKDTGFAGRLAYLRWLRARGRIAPESDREFAKAVGISEPWLYKWKDRADAPDSHEMRERLRVGLGLDSTWLFDGKGQPPDLYLWERWLERPTYLRVAEQLAVYGDPARPSKPAKKSALPRKKR